MAFDLSNKDEWLWRFAPGCLLRPRNLRLQWTANQWMKKTKDRTVASPPHDGERASFTIEVSAWESLWSLESPFPPRLWTIRIHFKCCCQKPRKTKNQGSGRSEQGEREREMDDREVRPWPAIHNPHLGYHPSKGNWIPAHDLHQKSFFLHVRCLNAFNGVSLLKFSSHFTQWIYTFQFLRQLTYWSLLRDFGPLHIYTKIYIYIYTYIYIHIYIYIYILSSSRFPEATPSQNNTLHEMAIILYVQYTFFPSYRYLSHILSYIIFPLRPRCQWHELIEVMASSLMWFCQPKKTYRCKNSILTYSWGLRMGPPISL